MAHRSLRAEKKSPARRNGLGTPPVEMPTAAEPGPLPQEEVRLRAYQKWQAAGCPPGDGVNFWLEAEQELHQWK